MPKLFFPRSQVSYFATDRSFAPRKLPTRETRRVLIDEGRGRGVQRHQAPFLGKDDFVAKDDKNWKAKKGKKYKDGQPGGHEAASAKTKLPSAYRAAGT